MSIEIRRFVIIKNKNSLKVENKNLDVKGKKIRMKKIKGKEMFSLTDIANQFGEGRADNKIYSWFKNKNTLIFLEAYEEEFNQKFKVRAMKNFIKRAEKNENALTLSDYEKETKSPFIHVQAGRNGGSWAVFQIASEFMMWISARFKVWFIADYERMKKQELLDKLNTDKFFVQKNVDNLMESLRYEQDRLQNLDDKQKELNS